MSVTLPNFSSDQYDPERMRELVRRLEQRFKKLEMPIGINYQLEGTVTGVKTLNVDTATDADIRQFLGSLINDLFAQGKLRRPPPGG